MDDPEGRQTGVDRRPSAVKEAWKRTNEDMAAIAERRREAGWDVVTIPALHTSPVSRDMGDDPERFGLVHVVPDNAADEFRAAYAAGEFPEYLVYRETVGNAVFLVTELQDPGTRTVIAVAAHYDAGRAEGMIRSAVAEGVINTYVRTIDGSELGSFDHGTYRPFLPEDGAEG